MGSYVSRSVKFHISNQTQNLTLKFRRDFFERGHFSNPPLPELSPGSSDTWSFSGDFWLGSVAGILVYESDSFSLAIYFSNSTSTELGLELSPGKVHLTTLETTYARMAKGTYSTSCQDVSFSRVVVDRSHERTVDLRHGRVRVRATMAGGGSATLAVTLEEQGAPREEVRGEKPARGRHYQKK